MTEATATQTIQSAIEAAHTARAQAMRDFINWLTSAPRSAATKKTFRTSWMRGRSETQSGCAA